MTDSNDRVARLAADLFTGNISERDARELDRWVKESPANDSLLRRRLRMLNYAALAAATAPPANRGLRLKRWMMWPAAAAVAAVWLALWRPAAPEPQIAASSTNAILFAGEQIVHLDGQAEVGARLGTVVVSDHGTELDLTTSEPMPYRLVVPRGSDYSLTLPDGTGVMLNSESSLVFPASFSSGERRVELRGEGFFSVAHRADQPFVVDLSEGSIAVHGTRFNVCDYRGEPLSAVLVEGSIAYNTDEGRTVMLIPDQRLLLDRATGLIAVEDVSGADYTAWTKNMLIFDAQSLEQIMTTLARWYDVEIVFEAPELKGLTLSGRLARDQDIRTLLNACRDMGAIDYRMEGRRVTIKKHD
jgi:ferric-dicitrate binding protein FerR (iron transport regulator)